ncbi:hypothetical protein [Pontibacter russatus]|uniref:hypothetical protein n=1 Tax=Pontibacter russatus TaxID=2694929 RepID=UPI001379944A|nr:hypothetical protein [Pontibacter russatus]
MADNSFTRLLSCLAGTRHITLFMFILLLAGGCTSREVIREESEVPMEEGVGEVPEVPYDGQLLAQVVFEKVEYIVPQQELMQPFMREFGDGTVIDQVMIRKVQETKEDEPVYYLVGLGIRNGAFRSMALALDLAADNSLYLSSKGAKHICRASIGCNFCFFTFSGNKITGCECDSRATENNCSHKFSEGNTLLQDVQLSNQRR